MKLQDGTLPNAVISTGFDHRCYKRFLRVLFYKTMFLTFLNIFQRFLF